MEAKKKTYFIRAGLSPLDNLSAAHMINHNSIGDNVGNLIYAYSIFRTLYTDKVEAIVPNYYKTLPEMAEEINESYDCFVIPLADAFRADFMPEMRKLTKLIKALKIPCVVIGVGLRAPFEPGEKMSYPFDQDIREFINAVLEKSSLIGVRGDYTSSYLTQLGYKEGIHHTVIGCPSMYTNGDRMVMRERKLNQESRISVNGSILSPNQVHRFLNQVMDEYPNHYFLPQRLQELQLLYTGMPYYHKQKADYPDKITDPVYKDDKVKFFLNVPTWLAFLRNADLSIGGRLHGNITAMIAGCPSILIPHDARMRELTKFHCLPHVYAKDLTEKMHLTDLLEKVDFNKVSVCHKKNFEHYIDFLDKNNLDHIYKETGYVEESLLDQKLNELPLMPPVESVLHCSFDEMADRMNQICPLMLKRRDLLKSENVKLKTRISDLERELVKSKEAIEMAEQSKAKALNAEKKAVEEKKEAKKAEAKAREELLNPPGIYGVMKRAENRAKKIFK